MKRYSCYMRNRFFVSLKTILNAQIITPTCTIMHFLLLHASDLPLLLRFRSRSTDPFVDFNTVREGNNLVKLKNLLDRFHAPFPKKGAFFVFSTVGAVEISAVLGDLRGTGGGRGQQCPAFPFPANFANEARRFIHIST